MRASEGGVVGLTLGNGAGSEIELIRSVKRECTIAHPSYDEAWQLGGSDRSLIAVASEGWDSKESEVHR